MAERRASGEAAIVYNVAPEPLTGFPLQRRLDEAHAFFLTDDAGPLTLRALETFDPMVLELILKHLGDIPEPASAAKRRHALATEKRKLERRAEDALAGGR